MRTAHLDTTWIGADLRRSVAAIDDPSNLHRRKDDPKQVHDRHVHLIERSRGIVYLLAQRSDVDR